MPGIIGYLIEFTFVCLCGLCGLYWTCTSKYSVLQFNKSIIIKKYIHEYISPTAQHNIVQDTSKHSNIQYSLINIQHKRKSNFQYSTYFCCQFFLDIMARSDRLRAISRCWLRRLESRKDCRHVESGISSRFFLNIFRFLKRFGCHSFGQQKKTIFVTVC